MKTLTISDISVTEELDRKAMADVRGGMKAYHSYLPWYGHGGDSTKNFSFDAVQQINQGQNVATNVGNNVAVLGGFASPHVAVTATQDADIRNDVKF